jgi:hypothetical protein
LTNAGRLTPEVSKGYNRKVSPSKQTFTFPISSELKRLLQDVKRRDGVAEAEQIRRGLRLWFESKGYRFDEEGRLQDGELGPAKLSAGPVKGRVTKKPKA